MARRCISNYEHQHIAGSRPAKDYDKILARVLAPNESSRLFPFFQPTLLPFCSLAQGGLVVG